MAHLRAGRVGILGLPGLAGSVGLIAVLGSAAGPGATADPGSSQPPPSQTIGTAHRGTASEPVLFLAPSRALLADGLTRLYEGVGASDLDFGTTAGAPPMASASPSRSPAGGPSARPPAADPWHEFYFTRAAYSSFRGFGRRGSWATDYPKADRQFLTVLKRLTNLDAFEYENAVLLTDEKLRRFPFLYALEVGFMALSPPEIAGLREYLKAGGFLVIDDFWGTREWMQFEYQIRQVFPDRPIIDLSLDHPVFGTFYDIDEILQVPAYGRYFRGRTSERDGYIPYVKGIEDDDGRLMVIINWNTDLGDAWEWAEQPDYPLRFSTFAYQMGVNMIIYAMSH